MAKTECRHLGYKLIGDYVFSEIVGDFVRDEDWVKAKHSITATHSALEGSLQQGFITRDELDVLRKDLRAIDRAVERADKKAAGEEFNNFFTHYATVIIDSVAECECRGGKG